jgi:hypothetical protein
MAARTVRRMSEDYVQFGQPPAAPKPKRRRSRTALLLVAGAIAAAGLGIAAVAASALVVGPKVGEAVEESSTFDIAGYFELVDEDVHVGGGTCKGVGGYSDISNGAQVIVTDAAGQTVALGQITDGFNNYPGHCRFKVVVRGVPKGSDFYGIEVTHRGRVQFSAADIAKPVSLSLSLGS